MEPISTLTRRELFDILVRMSPLDFTKELQAILEVRDVYLNNFLAESPVFEQVDEIYNVFLDVLVYKALPG